MIEHNLLSEKALYILNEMQMSEELAERINKLLEQEADAYIAELPWWEKDDEERWGDDEDEDE